MRKARHKNDARLLNTLFDAFRLLQIQIDRRGTVKGLLGITCRKNRQSSEPLSGQHEQRINILSLGQCPVAVDRRGIELASRFFSTVSDLLKNGADFKKVAQSAQRRPVPGFPCTAQANKTDSKFCF